MFDSFDEPVTALHFTTVSPGDKIVSYKPGTTDRHEILIVDKKEVIEKGEIADIVIWRHLDDDESVSYSSSPCDLGLSQSSDGTWYRRAIPFDENE